MLMICLTIRLSIIALAINLPKNLNFALDRVICVCLAFGPIGIGNKPNGVRTYCPAVVVDVL